MVQVHPQDTVDVPLAARRSAQYDCEIVLKDVRPVAGLTPGVTPGAEAAKSAKGAKVVEGAESTEGDFDINEFPLGRLAAAVDELLSVRTLFQFGLDGYGRPVVSGQAQATAVLPCQRCLEQVERTFVATLDQVIWFGDEPPGELSKSGKDVVLSRTTDMSFAALIEDDLLLVLPQKVCELDDCENLPTLTYSAPGYTSAGRGSQVDPDGQATDDLPDDRQRPFAGLGDLLKASADDSSSD